MKKKILALVLAIATFVSVFAVTAIPAYAENYQETYPIREYPHGSTYSSSKCYDYSYQCMAFAKYVSDIYAHRTSFSYITDDTLKKDRPFDDWDAAYKILNALDYGCYVRVHKKGSSDPDKGHSFILLSVSSSGAYVYDANYENDNMVRLHTIEPDEFLRRYDKIQVTMSHKFTKSPVSSDGTYHKVACSSSGCTGYKLVKHTFTYTNKNASYHWKTCSKCGFKIASNHTLKYINATKDTHKETCTLCSYSATVSHTGKTDSNGVTKCTGCGYVMSTQAGVASVDDEVASINNEIASVSDEITTIDDENTVADEETTVADEETTVADEETTVANEETTVANEGTTVTDEGTTVTDEETTVADEETTVADDETTTADGIAS